MEGWDMTSPDLQRQHPEDYYESIFVSALPNHAPVGLDDAVSTATRAYQALGVPTNVTSVAGVITTDLGSIGELPALVALSSMRIEIAVAADTPLGAVAASFQALADQGWQIILLVPLHRLAEAHEVCRLQGVSALQAYWDNRGTVVFGREEAP